MNKAKYLGRYTVKEYNKCFVVLEYEYRGRKYDVYENQTQGGEPLSWQHRNEQDRIDREIEIENKTKTKTEQTKSVDEIMKELQKYWDS